ncbi:MAG: ComF family protein [Candidatus Omnitrophota bacterium]
MFRLWFDALVDIVYPPVCLICRKGINEAEGYKGICTDCLSLIPKNIPPFCQKCGVSLSSFDKDRGLCLSCKPSDFSFNRAWAACIYKEEMVELIQLFKYKSKTILKQALGKLVCDFMENFHLPAVECDYLIPIPLHPARLREREFNQSQLLCEEIAKRFQIPLCLNNLIRIRNTKSQTRLNEKDRFKNIQGAFSLRNPQALLDKNVLLVDDLFTTGATASEAALTLKNGGAKDVCVLTLARAN